MKDILNAIKVFFMRKFGIKSRKEKRLEEMRQVQFERFAIMNKMALKSKPIISSSSEYQSTKKKKPYDNSIDIINPIIPITGYDTYSSDSNSSSDSDNSFSGYGHGGGFGGGGASSSWSDTSSSSYDSSSSCDSGSSGDSGGGSD